MGYIEEIRSLIGHKRIILPGSVVIIENDCNQILMQQRKHPYGKWGLPGGIMELGESYEQTAIREVFEETGLKIEQLKLINVYSGEDYLCIAENGDEFYSVTAAFYSLDSIKREDLIAVNDNESISIKWVEKNNLPEYIVKSHETIINDYLKIKIVKKYNY